MEPHLNKEKAVTGKHIPDVLRWLLCPERHIVDIWCEGQPGNESNSVDGDGRQVGESGQGLKEW